MEGKGEREREGKVDGKKLLGMEVKKKRKGRREGTR